MGEATCPSLPSITKGAGSVECGSPAPSAENVLLGGASSAALDLCSGNAC